MQFCYSIQSTLFSCTSDAKFILIGENFHANNKQKTMCNYERKSEGKRKFMENKKKSHAK